jgi:hypothetical protein
MSYTPLDHQLPSHEDVVGSKLEYSVELYLQRLELIRLAEEFVRTSMGAYVSSIPNVQNFKVEDCQVDRSDPTRIELSVTVQSTPDYIGLSFVISEEACKVT